MALASFGPGTGVSLVGYRGTGKSSVGKILARRLGRPFADSDAELEARTGRTIAAIFAEDGEPVFRDQEEALILDLVATQPGLVLSTGGGAILRRAASEALRAHGIVIWLTAPAEELAQRIMADRRGLASRPSLTGAGTLDEIEEILHARTPLYREVADLTIETVGKSAGQVVEAIIRNWPEAQR
jgi:shikimate kinase